VTLSGQGLRIRNGQHLLLNDSDFDTVKVESSPVTNIEKFVEVGTIDPIYYASSY